MGCTGSYHYSAIVDAPHNGCSGGGSFGKREALGMQRGITGVVGEVEAGHGAVRKDGFAGVSMGGWMES